jgi:hypothetical protein
LWQWGYGILERTQLLLYSSALLWEHSHHHHTEQWLTTAYNIEEVGTKKKDPMVWFTSDSELLKNRIGRGSAAAELLGPTDKHTPPGHARPDQSVVVVVVHTPMFLPPLFSFVLRESKDPFVSCRRKDQKNHDDDEDDDRRGRTDEGGLDREAE